MTTLVLIGPHSAGKTTLGRLLAHRLRWTFHEEIGRAAREAALRLDSSAHAAGPQPDFDLAVTRAELTRDGDWPHGCPRIVETWHPGNLAYARVRSEGTAMGLAPLLGRAVACTRAVRVQPLTIGPETLRRRRTEPGPEGAMEDFFLAVGQLAIHQSRAWNLVILPPIHTDITPPRACVERILLHLAASW